MTIWLHSTILATSLAATVAVGLASAAIYAESRSVAAKADRVPVVARPGTYLTVETRQEHGSVLSRLPVTGMN
jgi:hypothetical protein